MDYTSILLILTSCRAVAAWGCTNYCDSRDVNKYRQPGFSSPVRVGEVNVQDGDIAPSGLAYSRVFRDVLYFVSDSGRENKVYAIRASTADVIGSITITDATNTDWSDLAVGKCPDSIGGFCIYVLDAGKGGGGTPVNVVYVIKEETDPTTHVQKQADMAIKYTFQPSNVLKESASIFVDCQGNVFFFESLGSKKTGGVTLYQIVDIGGESKAIGIFKAHIPSTDARPVAASLSSDCSELLIKTHDKIYHIPLEGETIQMSAMQILPYKPVKYEKTVAWDTRGDRYYVLNNKKPFVLKVAKRTQDAPAKRYSPGRAIGTIDTTVTEEINALAGSRKHPGFVYVGSRFGKFDISVLQIFQGGSVGTIKTGIMGPTLGLQDMATGACPHQLRAPNCIYINTYQIRGGSTYKVYIFEEPQTPFGETQLTLDDEHVFPYELPAGFSNTPSSIMVGLMGEIYLMDYVEGGGMTTLFQLLINNGGSNVLVPLTTITSPSLHDGPGAIDMSPCFDEVLVKFWDIVVLFDVKDNKVAEALDGEGFYLPYFPETEGDAITFADCNKYLTAAQSKNSVPLMAYDRVP